MSLSTAGPIMGSGGREFSSGESVVFIFLLILPLIIYPACAWFFRKLLGSPRAIFLGLSPIVLPFLFFSMIDFLRYLDRKRHEQLSDGTIETVYHDELDGDLEMFVTYKDNKINGELLRVCKDGTIKYYGNYENGIKVGTHYEIENCKAPFLTKLTTYGPDEKVLDMKKFEQGLWLSFVHSFFEMSGNDETYFYRRYNWNPDKKRYYLANEQIRFNKGNREINNEYNESGKTISER